MSMQFDSDEPSMLDESECLAIYRRMKLVREFDDKIDAMYRAGVIAGRRQIFAGEEAVAVGAIHAMRREDFVVSTYHKWGHRIARGIDPRDVIAEAIGDAGENTDGDADAAMLPQNRTYFFDVIANGARGLSIAAGLALAIQYRK